MTQLRISDAAALAGVSPDTIRRLLDSGALPGTRDGARTTVDAHALALHMREHARAGVDPTGVRSSARNRMVGIVTAVRCDEVMAQVELQCGPFTVSSLMSSDAVRDLGLEPGSVAVAVVKATQVIVETEGEPR